VTRRAAPLLMVAHGTRDRAGTAVVEALADRVRTRRRGLAVQVAYVDVAEPSLASALSRLTGEIVLVPLLLGAGYHVKVDIPRALAAAPQVRAVVARTLGPDPLLAEALAERLAEAGAGRGHQLVLAAAGSSDPGANADAAAVARMLNRRTGAAVTPAYVCGGTPTVPEAVDALLGRGRAPVAVASYLLAPGHFARRVSTEVAAAGGAVTSSPLGDHDAVSRLVLRRYDEARAAVPGTMGDHDRRDPGAAAR
jgi:sirohydrochlorin ferrochelatase